MLLHKSAYTIFNAHAPGFACFGASRFRHRELSAPIVQVISTANCGSDTGNTRVPPLSSAPIFSPQYFQPTGLHYRHPARFLDRSCCLKALWTAAVPSRSQNKSWFPPSSKHALNLIFDIGSLNDMNKCLFGQGPCFSFLRSQRPLLEMPQTFHRMKYRIRIHKRK